jgi:hypothetical protein
MSDMERTELCREVEEQIADVLDGTAKASLYDHIADCDICRDLRHDAEQAAEMVSHSGGDFRADAGLADRLLARMDLDKLKPPAFGGGSGSATSSAAPTSSITATGGGRERATTTEIATAPTEIDAIRRDTQRSTLPDDEPRRTTEDRRAEEKPAETRAQDSKAAPRTTERASTVKSAVPASPAAKPATTGARTSGGKVVPLFRRPSFAAGLLGAMAAAAAVGFYLKGRTPTNTTDAPPPFEAAWTGKVEAVSRAAADKNGGVEACDAAGTCAPVAQGAAIGAGTTLRTDARTRAFVKLADGSQLALDRGSSITLGEGKERAARLTEGRVVADIADIQGTAPARIAFGQGELTLGGGKLQLTASKDRASVEVARGAAKLLPATGKAVEVRAGEEATVAGQDLQVASSASVADGLEWSDRSPEELDAPVLRGLGELRARKPGQTQEKGHAVRLAKHSVKVRVVDVVARTEVDETFTNDTDEELEGIFRFPLPPGAQIERLALEVDGKLMEGAFVDRDKGAAIWRGVIQNAAPKTPKPREEIIWVPGPWRDPALLEWQRGGRFELKIFPIPRKGSRRVVLSYTQVVDQAAGVRRFTYPLAHDPSGTTRIDAFDLDVQVLGHDKTFGVQTRGYELQPAGGDPSGERRAFHQDGFVPAGDLTVEYALPDRDREVTAWAYRMDPASTREDPRDKPSSTKAKTADEKTAEDAARAIASDTSPYVAIALRPKLPRWQEAKERLHVIVIDSSRSMVGERFARASRLASTLVREMDRRDAFLLLACDTTCRPMISGSSFGTSSPSAPGAAAAGEVERFLGSIEPDGGSDPAAAVSAARNAAKGLGGRELRIIYLGDGTPTVGPTRPSHLEAAVRSALPGGDGAVITVALGADADTTSLGALARGGGGVVIPYVPGQKVSSAAIDVLSAAYGVTLRDPEIELPPGLTQVTPTRLDPIRAGGEAFVVARMSGGEKLDGTIRLRGRVADERFEQTYPIQILASTSAGNAFVPRLYAAAKIAELERAGGESSKFAAIELSKRFAVQSRFTSLLVLESEAMMNAFGIDRTRVAPSFTGEEQAQSSSGDAEGEEEAKPDEAAAASLGDDTFGGGLAEKGKGESAGGGIGQGFGSGHGRLAGGSSGTISPAPTASPAPAPKAAEMEPSTGAADGPFAPPPPPARSETKATKRPWNGDTFDEGSWERRRRMIPMRKIFERKASFETTNTLASQNATRLLAAESALAGQPRQDHRALRPLRDLGPAGRGAGADREVERP